MLKQILDKEYEKLLKNLKEKVTVTRYKAAFSVNKELVLLYYHIGKQILAVQNKKGWGAKIIYLLSKDLQLAFTEMKGFSTRNLKYMRKFAEEYQDPKFVQQLVAQLLWGHNVILMEQVVDLKNRIFYIEQAIGCG